MLTRVNLPARRFLGVFTVALTLSILVPPLAASAAVDDLIARLPKPETWTKSPLQAALKDPDPMLRDPVFREFAVSLSKRDVRQALASARTLAQRYPKNPAVHFLRGLLALQEGQYAEAEGSLRRVIALRPSTAPTWQWLALCQSAQKHYSEGAASARKAVELAPESASSWVTLCVLQYRQHEFPEAQASALRATRIAPGSVLTWAMLGGVQASRRQFPDAVESYRRGLRLAPSNVYLLAALGGSLAASGQVAAAIPVLQHEIAVAPRAYGAMTLLAACYAKSGQPGQGDAWCRRALKVKSNHAPAWRLLGECSQWEGKNREAAAAFAQAARYGGKASEPRDQTNAPEPAEDD